MTERSPNVLVVPLPTQASSWLTQSEISVSIIQRQVLTPNDCPTLAAVEERLLAFKARYNDTAVPFPWRLTREQWEERLAHLAPTQLADGPLAATPAHVAA